MNKPRTLAALALGLSLGLAGFGPVALAQRGGHEEPEAEAADSCSTTQENESDNSTGDASQSGLININNIGIQGNNLDVLGNLLCQGVFLNDIVAGVLGFAQGGDGDHDGDGHGDDGCSTSQDNSSENETGDAGQHGLVNLNNVALQGNNLGVGGNLLCGGNFLNDVVAGILGFAEGGDGDHDGGGADDGCSTDMTNDSENETGETIQGGLIGVNNIGVQGNNIDALGNALCSGNFLNGLTAGILGHAEQGDDDGDHHRGRDRDRHFGAAGRGDRDHDAACSTDMDNSSENETGDSLMGGLLNLNNLAVQGNNIGVLSNGLCGSIFLNDVLVSVLGLL